MAALQEKGETSMANFHLYRTFEAGMAEVNQAVEAKIGCAADDLPDCCYADWYDHGVTPKGAAARAIKAARGD